MTRKTALMSGSKLQTECVYVRQLLAGIENPPSLDDMRLTQMNKSSELTVIDPKSVEATSFKVRVHSELPMKAYCCTQASRTTGFTGLALREKVCHKD